MTISTSRKRMWLVFQMFTFSQLKAKDKTKPSLLKIIITTIGATLENIRKKEHQLLGASANCSQSGPSSVGSGRKTESSQVVTGCVSARWHRASDILLEQPDFTKVTVSAH